MVERRISYTVRVGKPDGRSKKWVVELYEETYGRRPEIVQSFDKKEDAVEYARSRAKYPDNRPSKLNIYNKDGELSKQTRYD